MKRSLPLCLVIVALTACGGSDFASSTSAPTEDSGVDTLQTPDTSKEDTEPDSGIDSGSPDTEVPDTGIDSGSPDTGLVDTGTPDTDVPDTTAPDTGTDTQIPDTNVADTSAPDTTPTDTGSVDSGPFDTGSVDTGDLDSGAADTGVSDTGVTDTGPDAPACVEGALACMYTSIVILPDHPMICIGGKWVVNGGRCNFGCDKGLCLCTDTSSQPILQKPAEHIPYCIPDSVGMYGNTYFPKKACGADTSTPRLWKVGFGISSPYNLYVPKLYDMNGSLPGELQSIMVQSTPVTMKTCSDGSPFYPFEQTYFTRDVSTVKCFWASDTIDGSSWRWAVMSDGKVEQLPPTTVCHLFVMGKS